MSVRSIKQFYSLMFHTRDVKRNIINKILNDKTITDKYTKELKKALYSLKNIPQKEDKYILNYQNNKKIQINLDYEISELEKDIKFLSSTKEVFIEYLGNINQSFHSDLNSGLKFLKGINFCNFVSDRDGTVNNYCGRYKSSIQSIYNAAFLIEFARNLDNAIILTSAPLQDIGFLDVNIIPEDFYIFAGSKGREFITNNQKFTLDISSEKQEKLNQLNEKLQDITKKPEYEIFSIIGSGLQFKFGQTTIARQDIHNSIPEDESNAFLEKIKSIVKKFDPDKKYFSILDTGKDIEIILKKNKQGTNSAKDFDKGDGTEFILNKLDIRINKGYNLICGDTASDLSMLEYTMNQAKQNYTIFVTEDKDLRQRVDNLCDNSLCINSPDALITILYKHSQERSS